MSSFTCIACRVAFQDADLQRNHYKTDWHRYNLKRKVADMPPVTAENFQQRLQTLKAQEESEKEHALTRCSVCNKNFSTENAYENHIRSKKHKETAQRQGHDPADETDKVKVTEKNRRNDSLKKELVEKRSNSKEGDLEAHSSSMDVDDDDDGSWESWEGEPLDVEQCLFCSHVSKNLDKNIQHMTREHSFFIPDIEYVCDLEGLISYLGEKVGAGHICLWCNEKSKTFLTTKSVQQHMVDKGHCKMLHDGDAVFEYADFYDYRASYPDYNPDEDSTEDEEVVDDEKLAMDMQDENSYQLVLPSGVVVGHRSLMRYYRQKLQPERHSNRYATSKALRGLMSEYKALGWTGTTGILAQKRAKDLLHFQRLSKKRHMMLGVKANKLQKHYRDQVFGY